MSPVRLAPIEDTENPNGFSILVESRAVVADAESVLGRLYIVELFHVAGPVAAKRSTECLMRRAIPLSSDAISSSAASVHSTSLTPCPSL